MAQLLGEHIGATLMIEPLVWSVATLAAMRHLTTAAIYLLALHGTTPQQRPAIIKALNSLHRKAS